MIYVDDMRLKATVGRITAIWCHMWSSTSDQELNDFALKIGLKLSWLQKSRNGFVHYDVTESRRATAIALGAKEVHYGDFVGWERKNGQWNYAKS